MSRAGNADGHEIPGSQVGLQSMACPLGIVGRLSVYGDASVPFGLGVISAP